MLRDAFTLIEVVVAVLIIGILAAVAVPRVADCMESSCITGTVSNLRAMESAAQLYYAHHGDWPRDGLPQQFPPDFEGYIDQRVFTTPPGIGGKYDWNSQGRYGDVHAGISILWPRASDYPTELCLAIDTQLDDGNLATGKIRTYRGRVLQFELEPEQ